VAAYRAALRELQTVAQQPKCAEPCALCRAAVHQGAWPTVPDRPMDKFQFLSLESFYIKTETYESN